MTDKMTVGFIGLGDQGAPIAQRIADAGYPLKIWARRSATIEKFAGAPAEVMADPPALGAACNMVGVCVVNDDDVREVVLSAGLLAAMRPGAVLAIHSTLLPETVIALAEEGRQRGVHVLDAPVSGGSNSARAGTMAVMIGGEAEALAIARPVLETFAESILHLGGAGAGQIIKLLNNNLCYAIIVMAIDALELAERLGVDRTVAADVIKVSSGGSAGFNIVADLNDLQKIVNAGSILRKDVQSLVQVARDCGAGDADLLALSQTVHDRLVAFADHVGAWRPSIGGAPELITQGQGEGDESVS